MQFSTLFTIATGVTLVAAVPAPAAAFAPRYTILPAIIPAQQHPKPRVGAIDSAHDGYKVTNPSYDSRVNIILDNNTNIIVPVEKRDAPNKNDGYEVTNPHFDSKLNIHLDGRAVSSRKTNTPAFQQACSSTLVITETSTLILTKTAHVAPSTSTKHTTSTRFLTLTATAAATAGAGAGTGSKGGFLHPAAQFAGQRGFTTLTVTGY